MTPSVIFSIICLVLGCLLAVADGKCERTSQMSVRTYKIDLDVAPADRFTEVIRDFKQEILVLFESERFHL